MDRKHTIMKIYNIFNQARNQGSYVDFLIASTQMKEVVMEMQDPFWTTEKPRIDGNYVVRTKLGDVVHQFKDGKWDAQFTNHYIKWHRLPTDEEDSNLSYT